jgi:hypothetical protein
MGKRLLIVLMRVFIIVSYLFLSSKSCFSDDSGGNIGFRGDLGRRGPGLGDLGAGDLGLGRRGSG